MLKYDTIVYTNTITMIHFPNKYKTFLKSGYLKKYLKFKEIEITKKLNIDIIKQLNGNVVVIISKTINFSGALNNFI